MLRQLSGWRGVFIALGSALLLLLAQLPVAATPTPTPSPGPPASEGPAGQPYNPVEQLESELHKKLAKKRPDFGPEDRLSRAWARKAISVDEYIRYSVQRVAQPDRLPAKFQPEDGLPHSAGLAMGYALSLLDKASPETQAWVKDLLVKPGRAEKADAAAAAWADCATPYIEFLHWFSCKRSFTSTIRFDLYYRIDGFSKNPDTGASMDGVPAVDTSPANGVPDAVDKVIASLTVAAQQYKAMGYGLTGDHIEVYLGFDYNDNPGLTFPFGDLIDGGPVIFMPSDPADIGGESWYTYLPRHELFHANQYHYLPNLHLGMNLTSINWWMEATAEWATHEVYRRIGATAPGADAYSSHITRYLAEPNRAINAHDGMGKSRQYGLFPLAVYLTERTHPDFVLRTWEEMDDALPLEAIQQVAAGYGRNIRDELRAYMVANYRMDTPVQALSDFLGASSGYQDPDAKNVWRARLAGSPGRPRSQHAAPAWGATQNGVVNMGPGGTHYVEIYPPATGQGRVTATATGPTTADTEKLRTLLVVFPFSGGTVSMNPLRWVLPDASGRLATTLKTGEVAALMLLRTDLVPDSGDAVDSAFNTTWNVALTAETGASIMVVGDSITHGSEGDYTWRYRLANHFTAKGARVDFVGPRRGTYDKYTDQRMIAQIEGRAMPPQEFYPGPSTGSYRDGNFDSEHNAMWGWTYVDAIGKIKADVAAARPDYLAVALGFNDIAFWGGADATIGYFKNFVAEARAAKPDLKILVSNVINRTELPGYEWLNPAITDYKAKLLGVAASLSTPASPVHVVDVNTGFNPVTDTYDGVHPNGLGEYKFAKAYADAFAAHFSLGSAFGSIPGSVPDLSITTPASVTATPTAEGITIRWARVFGASGYYLHSRDATAGEAFQKLPMQIGGDHWISRWVIKDHRYEFKISTARGSAETAPSGVAAAVPNPLTLPQTNNVKLTPADGKITVAWTATPGATGYQIYGMGSDGVWLPTLDVTGTSATYTGLANDRIYNIAVAGVNRYGPGMPGAGLGARAGHGKPPAVSMTDAWTSNHHEANLTWQDSLTAVGYWIEGMDHTQANPTWGRLPIPITPDGTGNNPGFTAGYLMSGATNYSFRVIPANGALEAAPSAAKRVRYIAPSLTADDPKLKALQEEVRKASELRNRLPAPAFGLIRPDAENCYCAVSD
ncbi:GDSL-type esterase/lipase family protein [Nonomuraea sp. NPDC049152]|uniref:GDSL-type esterase/lipase family protein n=1 Tax=Nonomuraea sp. NPDC049152 TaxID=3154350 RepID=UPI0033F9930C